MVNWSQRLRKYVLCVRMRTHRRARPGLPWWAVFSFSRGRRWADGTLHPVTKPPTRKKCPPLAHRPRASQSLQECFLQVRVRALDHLNPRDATPAAFYRTRKYCIRSFVPEFLGRHFCHTLRLIPPFPSLNCFLVFQPRQRQRQHGLGTRHAEHARLFVEFLAC